MAQLYAVENFDARIVAELRQYGHDVQAAHEAGQAGQGISDVDGLAFAVSQNRAVLTFDRRDVIRIHKMLSAFITRVSLTVVSSSARTIGMWLPWRQGFITPS
jgi:hypothetical protein